MERALLGVSASHAPSRRCARPAPTDPDDRYSYLLTISAGGVAITHRIYAGQLDRLGALEFHCPTRTFEVTMAKAIRINASPTWPDVNNDYTLSYEGHSIGRIRLDQAVWQWQITIPMAMPAWANGSADSLEESKRSFALAWGRLLNETGPARLERAWELERAVEARRQRMDIAREDSAKSLKPVD